jgi:HlyD family secretion protein
VLFTLVNDLTKMQINAAVAEADVGSIAPGQEVKFTVDAFPNRTFAGKVRMVRNAASSNQSVVSYATIIDVGNDDMKLKPGMTANVSIIVTQRPGVLRVGNGALRVRVPQELLPKSPEIAAKGGKADAKGGASAMTDDERRRAVFEIMRTVGFERGSPPTAEQIEKAKALAKDKGMDPDLVAASLAMPGGRKRSESGGGDRGGSSRSFGGGGPGGPPGGDRGFNNTVVSRTLYKIVNPEAEEKKLEAVQVRLGISDGFFTEVLGGLTEGDTVLTNITIPGATAAAAPQGGMQNPFSGSRGGPPSSSGMRGSR